MNLVKPAFKIIPIDEIPMGSQMIVDIWPDGKLISVIITHRKQGFSVFLNQCSHARWRLENIDGDLLIDENQNLICSGHCAIFDATDGHFIAGPGKGEGLISFNYEINNNEIIIGKKYN